MIEKQPRPAAPGEPDRAGATEGFGDAFGPPNSKLQSDEQYVPRDLKGVPVWVWNRDGPARAIAEIVVTRWVVQTYIRWCHIVRARTGMEGAPSITVTRDMHSPWTMAGRYPTARGNRIPTVSFGQRGQLFSTPATQDTLPRALQ
jgi:hypothetical protein